MTMIDQDISPSPAHALPGPDDITRVTLDNGITVLARENFTSPSVVVDGMVRGGSLLETHEKAGLANLHASLLTRGTENYSFGELYEEIESIGADVAVSSGGHTYSFDSKSLAEDLPTMLGLLAEVLRRPTFPAEQIERVRGQIVTGLQMREHNTRSMAQLKFKELCYPEGHPYGRPVSGYLETVPNITREDILAFQRNLGPRDAIITVVGAVKAADAVRMVEEAFGDWENADQPPLPTAPDVPALEETRQTMVTIPGKTQSDIVLGVPGPARGAEDYQAARMANSVLGVFGMMGRLGVNVRENQGLAYYSASRLTGGLGPGPWRVFAGVDPANVNRAIESIRDEVRQIVEEPVSAEELDENRSYMKGQLVLGLETNDGVASTISRMALYDLGLDYLENYHDMIDGITAEDVQAAAARYLDPDVYALAVAGPE